MPITMIETDNAARRPARSPKAPMTRPPRGRNMNATPKTASDASNEVVGFPDGKNSAPMRGGKKPVHREIEPLQEMADAGRDGDASRHGGANVGAGLAAAGAGPSGGTAEVTALRKAGWSSMSPRECRERLAPRPAEFGLTGIRSFRRVRYPWTGHLEANPARRPDVNGHNLYGRIDDTPRRVAGSTPCGPGRAASAPPPPRA